MKISLQWLQDYVEVQDFFSAPEKLAQKLTSVGLEVEGLQQPGQAFHHVVVGQIKELTRHPNSDRLTVCQVDVGEAKLRQIICGARNHQALDRVVVALPGAILPKNFAIKVSKIRDVESLGMLCSEAELGLSQESEGILILPESAPIGLPFAEYKGWNDVLLDLNVTPNRSDCLSHFGLAREIGCVWDRPVHFAEPKFTTTCPDSQRAWTKTHVHLELKDPVACPRYAGRVIKGVRVGPSPDWLKRRLESVGVNSINNVVDVTNYVMWELGQPLHAFDLQLLHGAKIVVDHAVQGEVFESFDGTQFRLTGDELTIRDESRALALAGIVGGKNSGVSESTVNLFIESAHFSSDFVRRTSRRWGLQTDSCYRFSRGTDPEGVLMALNRACQLIQELAGGEVASDFFDEYPNPVSSTPIVISVEEVSQRLGYLVDVQEFLSWMKRLGCHVQQVTSSSTRREWAITTPLYRWDLRHKTDLVEEFGRLKGYEHIPEHFPSLHQKPLAHDREYVLENHLSEIIKGTGFLQAVNYGFLSSAWQSQLLGSGSELSTHGLEVSLPAIALRNPLSEDMDVMRVSLLPGLMKNLLHNARYNNELGRLFEIGHVFYRPGGEHQPGQSEGGGQNRSSTSFQQVLRVGLIAWGQKAGLWNRDGARPVVFDLKSSLETVLDKLCLFNFQWQTPQTLPPLFHPTQSVALFCEGRRVGLVGSLHPELVESFKLRFPVAMAEFDFEKLMRGQPRLAKLQSLPKFPGVERDFAFVIPLALPVMEVIKEIRKSGGGLIKTVEVVDVFTGDPITEGLRSVTLRAYVQDKSATLTDGQIEELQQKVIKSVTHQFQVQLREGVRSG